MGERGINMGEILQTQRGSVGEAGIDHRAQPSVTRAGKCTLLADPEFVDPTLRVIPAFALEFCTIFLPTAIGFPFVPILLEAAKATQTVSPHPTVLALFLASVNLTSSQLPCTHEIALYWTAR